MQSMLVRIRCRPSPARVRSASMRTPVELGAVFREQGLKVTPQRQLLFRLLHGNATHPTAEALFGAASELMPGISLRTVYQTLNDLTAMGELQMLTLGPGSARFDPNVADHHHVVCEGCGDVRDVYVAGIGGLSVQGQPGFQARAARIVFHGACERCDPSLVHDIPITSTH